MTMRPIFSPSVRVKVLCPSRRGCGELAGRTNSGFASGAEAFKDFDFRLRALGGRSRWSGRELLPLLEASNEPVATGLELESGHCSETAAVSPPGFLAATVWLSRAGLLAVPSVARDSSVAVFSERLALAVRSGSAPMEFPYRSITSCVGSLVS